MLHPSRSEGHFRVALAAQHPRSSVDRGLGGSASGPDIRSSGYGLGMKQRTRSLAIWSGAGVALIGSIVTVVYLFQPWRTCPYDDSPSACAMLPMDATVMAIAMWSTLVGLVILGLGVFMKRVDTAP